MKLSVQTEKKLLKAAENAVKFSGATLSSHFGGDTVTMALSNLRKEAANINNVISDSASSSKQLLKAINSFEARLQAVTTVSGSASFFHAQTNQPQIALKEIEVVLAALDEARAELGGGSEPTQAEVDVDAQLRLMREDTKDKQKIQYGYLVFALVLIASIFVSGILLMLGLI